MKKQMALLSSKFLAKRSLIALFVMLTAFLNTGCASLKIEPWVKPYERQNLADPIMSFSRDPASDGYLHHVHQAREAARGAEGSAGGGCGCN